MYQWSLESFIRFYKLRLSQSQKSNIQSLRLKYIMDDITFNIYRNISRGMFTKDRLLFSFMIAAQIELDMNLISEAQIMYLVLNQIDKVSSDSQFESKRPDYIDINQWTKISKLAIQDRNNITVLNTLENDSLVWKDFAQCQDHSQF